MNNLEINSNNNSTSENNSSKKEYNRYNNSKVYKIINTIDDTFYIGSTCTSLSKRLSQHKARSQLEKYKHNRVYNHLNEIEHQNIKIVLICEFYLDNKKQLLREENNYIEMYKNDPNCLNTSSAIRSPYAKTNEDRRYYEKHCDSILFKQQIYRNNNKEKIEKKTKYIKEQR